MDIEYRENRLSAKDVIQFQHKMGWNEDPIEQWESSLNKTLFSVIALKDDEMIGMGRLLGDASIYWYIQDVFILTEYQGLGIGTEIVKRLIQHVKENSISGTSVSIFLMSAKGKEGFYEKLGFLRRPHDLEGAGMEMEIKICRTASLRNRYKPDVIKVLFVGESRPKGGTFFYEENSALYEETKKAFDEYFAQDVFTCENFKRWNCWLYDICDEPVNDKNAAERRDNIRKNIPRLVEMVQQTNPKYIIVCKKGLVEKEIKKSAIMDSRSEGENIFFLPFPAFGNQKKFREGLMKALNTMKFTER